MKTLHRSALGPGTARTSEARSMVPVKRAGRGAVLALALAIVVAAPAAATQPTRTVMYDPPSTAVLPAGTFCAFAVTTDRPAGRRLTYTDYSNGREAVMGLVVRRTYTNPASGKSFTAPTDAHEVDWFAAYPMVSGTAEGQFLWLALPGDVGPGGVIIDHLTPFFIRGSVTYLTNWESGATSRFSMTGTATDICAAIS